MTKMLLLCVRQQHAALQAAGTPVPESAAASGFAVWVAAWMQTESENH